MNDIRLNPTLDAAAIRDSYAAAGRVHVADVLVADSARAIHRALADSNSWQLSLNSGDRHVDLPTPQLELLPSAAQVLLVDAVNRSARTSFQYIFNNIPLHDLHLAGQLDDPALVQAYAFLNSDGFLAFARTVTGMNDIAFADAQATWYRPGHFLTAHDDSMPGKNRRAAYVLNLTEHWLADWGGILQFLDEDGHVTAGYTPKFNALNLLRVPQRHCVSYVSPAAAHGRYSITGWLRAN